MFLLVWSLACALPEPPVVMAEDVASGVVFLDERSPPDFRLARWQSAETAETVFAVPSGGFLFELDIHDGHGQIAMAYTAPGDGDTAGYDRSGIFRVEPDGQASRVACEDVSGVWCFYPQWSADGERLWYIRVDKRTEAPVPVLAWINPDTGEGADVQTWVTEPAVSPNGALAWIRIDPNTGARSLELGNAEGAWRRTLIAEGQVEDLGQPLFSADGSAVWVVVLEPETEQDTAVGWLAGLLSTAYAHESHDLPGDWWAVSVDGGAPQRLSWLGAIHYDGAVDPHSGDLFTVTQLGLARVRPESGETDWLWSARTLRAVDTAP